MPRAAGEVLLVAAMLLSVGGVVSGLILGDLLAATWALVAAILAATAYLAVRSADRWRAAATWANQELREWVAAHENGIEEGTGRHRLG